MDKCLRQMSRAASWLQQLDYPGSFALATANIQEGARLDIAMNGFWGVGRNAVLWI